mgnify:CR=1 FL=1
MVLSLPFTFLLITFKFHISNKEYVNKIAATFDSQTLSVLISFLFYTRDLNLVAGKLTILGSAILEMFFFFFFASFYANCFPFMWSVISLARNKNKMLVKKMNENTGKENKLKRIKMDGDLRF